MGKGLGHSYGKGTWTLLWENDLDTLMGKGLGHSYGKRDFDAGMTSGMWTQSWEKEYG